MPRGRRPRPSVPKEELSHCRCAEVAVNSGEVFGGEQPKKRHSFVNSSKGLVVLN